MLQEISPLQFDNSFHPRAPQPEDMVLCCDGDNVLVGQGDALALPRAADVSGAAFTFLFTVGGQDIFLAHTLAPVMMPGFAYRPLSSLRRAQPKALLSQRPPGTNCTGGIACAHIAACAARKPRPA